MTWHPGERAVQRRAGSGAQVEGLVLPPEIPPVAQDFLAERPWLVVGAADDEGRMWATALHGPPGFLHADERSVHVAATPVPGDPLAPVLAREADVGALAIDPATRRRMRLNGRSRPLPGGLLLETEQVYANCPKYIVAREPAPAARRPGTPVTGGALDAAQAAQVRAADTFFVATRAPGHGADASHRGGRPGFVVVHDERHLTWPDYRGNGMFNTLGNLEADPAAGLLFCDFARGDLLLLSGRARVVWDPSRVAEFPRAQRLVDLTVEHVVARPGAAPLLWDGEQASKVSPPAPEGPVSGPLEAALK
ncbi:MAG: pyridoxamine 5'-phosphate oxidase family protein [Solirubrobacterales bacterium]|nr:pyridoxamine 5'-phosphate oxidase family protein [Solirubrobacterales bacterium]